MSVLRQLNILGQMRLDVPHIRSLESSIAADFDVVAGRVQAGEKAVVIRGFSLANFAAGTAANSVQMSTADGILYNMNASEAGTFLWVSADRDVEILNSATNARVNGSFTAGQVNYIGLDLTRSADSTTTDLVQFLDPNTLLENTKNVPLGRTLDYRIVISATPFSSSPNLVPIAKIKTDASNNVGSAVGDVQDARNGLWRLGSGGDFPNRFSSFTWAQNRVESVTGTGLFTGGDKAIQSQKDWMDAVMTRLWELGGGENWYSTTADRNVRMLRVPSPVFASTGDNFEWVAGLYASTHLHWQSLKIVFDNSNTAAVYYNTVDNQTADDATGSAATSKTALADGDCIYVDIDRTSNAAVTAKKASLQTLSVPAIPGSRLVLAWRVGANIYTRDTSLAVGVSFQPATTTVAGAVRLNEAPNPAHAGSGVPTVVTLNSNNSINVGNGSYTLSGASPGITVVGYSAGDGTGIHATGGGSGSTTTAAVQAVGSGAGPTNGIGVHATGGGGGSTTLAAIRAIGFGTTGIAIIASSTDISSIRATSATQAGVLGISTSAQGLMGTSTSGQGVRGTSTTGLGVYGTGGNDQFGYGVFGEGTHSLAPGVAGAGWNPQSVSQSADGGHGGFFFAGPGSAFTPGTARNGGFGMKAFGGLGSNTNTGGAGGRGLEAWGAAGGQALQTANPGGFGGLGLYAQGGAGGYTTNAGSTAAAQYGAAGGEFKGGQGGHKNSALEGNGGDGVYATGGDGGTPAGAGRAGYGITALGGVGPNAIGGVFIGSGHAGFPGTGLTSQGGANSAGNGAKGLISIGGTSSGTSSIGGDGATITGGAGAGTSASGGGGVVGSGGAGGSGASAVGGTGVKGVGGAGSIGSGGWGGHFQGGVGTVAGGIGVVGENESGNGAGVWGRGRGTAMATQLGFSFSNNAGGKWAGGVFTGKNFSGDGGYGCIVAGDESGVPNRAAMRLVPQQTFPANAEVGDLCAPLAGVGVDAGKVYSRMSSSWQPIGGRARCMAAGTITLDNSTTPDFNGQNADSCSANATTVFMNFVVAFPASPTAVLLQLGDELGTTMYFAKVTTVAASGFQFKIRDGAGTLINPSTTGGGLIIQWAAFAP